MMYRVCCRGTEAKREGENEREVVWFLGLWGCVRLCVPVREEFRHVISLIETIIGLGWSVGPCSALFEDELEMVQTRVRHLLIN